VPFGSGVTWPSGWQGRDEIIATKLQVFRAAPFVAWSFGALRVAVGAHADFGRMQIQRDLDFIDMQGDVAIDMDGHGFGVDASAFWQARKALSFGAIYRSRTHLPLHGGADFTAPDPFGAKIPDQHAASSVTLPDQLAVGARYTHGALAVLADAELTMWSTSDKLVVDFEQMQTPDVTQQQQWHDTVSLRAGTEWTRGRFTLRDGVYLEPSPAPTKTLAPTVPDATRLGVSTGASWQLSRALAVDGFVELMWLLRRDTSDVDALQASYGGRATLAGVGVRWTP
jgi:long-chain fatty acid transport protein